MAEMPSPRLVAETLTAFVDLLIPGDEDFPAASSVGTQGLVSNRIRERLGNDAFARIVEGLNQSQSLISAPSERRHAIVSQFSESEPELFAFLRFATYFSYYETPQVVAALQSLGHDYNDAPQPRGYYLPPFDPVINIPAEPRGSYKKTAEITPLDLSSLAELELPVKGA